MRAYELCSFVVLLYDRRSVGVSRKYSGEKKLILKEKQKETRVKKQVNNNRRRVWCLRG